MQLNKKLFSIIVILICAFWNYQISAQEVTNSKVSEGEPNSSENAANNQQNPDQNNDNKITTDKIDKADFANTAILQGLNKITAKTSELRVKVGSQIEFGRLTIIVHKCWQAPLDQRPESKILLEIYETNLNKVKSRIFYGWMFASTPSISGLEHPIYDITAIGCKFK